MARTDFVDDPTGANPLALVDADVMNGLGAAINGISFNVIDHGVVHDGSTNNTTALAAVVDAAAAAGGGTILFPPATSQYIGSLVVDVNVPIKIVGYGATLQGPSGGTALTINTGQTGGSGQNIVVEGLTIKGNADQTTDGVLIRDTSRARLENCYITRVDNGVLIQNYASGQNSEGTTIRSTLINDCVTGIRMETVSGGPSFDETVLHDVGINNCTTGIYLPTGSNHVRSCLDATIWVGRTGSTDGVALYTDADMKRVWGRFGGEKYAGATSCTGVMVGPNAFGFDECDLQLHLQPSINPKVDVTTSGGSGQFALWREGLANYGLANGTSSASMVGPHIKSPADTYPRVGFTLGSPANAPMPGGRYGLFFGSGSAQPDAVLFRPGIAGVLQQGFNNSFKTGQSTTGSMPSAATHGLGAQYFDTTLNRPKWSDGTNWINVADRASHTGTQAASTISDFSAAADARIAAATTLLASSYPTVSPGVVNTTTETALASLTVPAAQLLAGDRLVFDLAWDILNNSGSAVTYTYRLKVGATTVGTSSALSIGASAQRAGIRGRFIIALPALNTPRVWGDFVGGFAGGGFTGMNTSNSGVLTPAEPSVDFSSDVVVQLTCQMGTASASADFRLHAATITRQR